MRRDNGVIAQWRGVNDEMLINESGVMGLNA
jgi:hypothetical protein